MFTKSWRVIGLTLCGVAALASLPRAAANDNPALGIGEPNTPFAPPTGPRGCGDVPCDGCDDTGSPVFLTLGQWYRDFEDLTFGELTLGFKVSRRYNSGEFYVGFFGRGFHSTLDMMSIAATKGNLAGGGAYRDDVVVVRWPDGRRSLFTKQPNDTFTGPAGRFDTLTKTGGGYELRTPEGLVHVFDNQSKLLSVTDRNGNALSFAYDGSGRPALVTLPGSRPITITYNASGFVESISDFAGRTVTYSYDAQGYLIDFTDARGGPWSYEYDNGKLARIIDPLDRTVVSVTYDGQGRVSQMTDEDGSFTYTYVSGTSVRKHDNATGGDWVYDFDALGEITRITDPNGGITQRVYNANQNMTSVTRYGDVTTYTYDSQGRILTRTEPTGGGTWAYTYNSLGLVETETDPYSVVTRYYYDAAGNRTRLVENFGGPLQRESTFTYDAAGNLATATRPAGGTEIYGYDSFGRMTSFTDALSHLHTYAYDALGRMTSATDPLNHTVLFAYDALGAMTSLTDPLGNSFLLQYDPLGKLTSITDRTGNPTTYGYDTAGRETRVTNALNYSIVSAYDSTGRLTMRRDALNNTMQYAYGATGYLTAVTDPFNQITTYGVNVKGQRTSLTDPAGRTVNYVYNYAGNLTKITYPGGAYDEVIYGPDARVNSRRDRNGQTTTLAYDALGRLTLVTYPGSVTVTYGYDAADRLTAVTNAAAPIAYTYNLAGWLLSETNQTLGKTVSYGYDNAGRRTSVTDAEGLTTAYAYDAADNLTQITHPTMGGVVFGDDDEGRRTSATYGDGSVTSYAYDSAGHLAQVEHKRADQSVIASVANLHNEMGHIIGRTDTDGVHSYGYDALYRLTGAIHPNPGVNPDESYGYNAVGNRTVSHLSAGYTYDDNNRLLQDDAYTYVYDANGNLTAKTDRVTSQVTYHRYNAVNQLVEVEHPDATFTRFTYDGRERRVSMTSSTGTVTQYLYDGQQVIAEYDGTSTLQAAYVNAPGMDEPLLVSRGGTTLRYHNDGMSSILAMTNTNGVIDQSYAYDSFGRIVAEAGTTGNSITFTGREWDAEVSLYYYRARSYDPRIGRFLQVDPEGPTVGPNNYVYVAHNPLYWSDPLGLSLVYYGNCCGPGNDCSPGGNNCEKGPKDETDQCCNIHDRCLNGTGGWNSCDAPSRQCHREIISCWNSGPASKEKDTRWYRGRGTLAFRGILTKCATWNDGIDKVKDGWDWTKDRAGDIVDGVKGIGRGIGRGLGNLGRSIQFWKR